MEASLRVLIVDDNVIYADALRRLVERERHAVVGMTDHAGEALAMAARFHPDLALVDVALRDGHTGPELGRRLGASGTNVLFVTASPELVPADAPGVVGTLHKPAGDARLRRAIAAVARTRS